MKQISPFPLRCCGYTPDPFDLDHVRLFGLKSLRMKPLERGGFRIEPLHNDLSKATGGEIRAGSAIYSWFVLSMAAGEGSNQHPGRPTPVIFLCQGGPHS